jgi:hypothetical protein
MSEIMRQRSQTMELDEFFRGFDESRPLFDAINQMIDSIGPAQMRVTRSQIVYRRRKAFAWLWTPARYLKRNAAPLVLTLGFRHRDTSPRWKEIVEPKPGYFTHHLGLYSIKDVDDQVLGWLQSAWQDAV